MAHKRNHNMKMTKVCPDKRAAMAGQKRKKKKSRKSK
mgnify:CR=1 FL=1